MNLLVVILDRELTDKYTGILNSDHDKSQVVLLAQGTASSEILDYFGLARKDKAVILCLLTDQETKPVLERLQHDKEFQKNGGAVAFTTRLANINKRFYDLILSLGKTEV